jgi:hypothetical protein
MAAADRGRYVVVLHTDADGDPLHSVELFGPFTHQAAWALLEHLQARLDRAGEAARDAVRVSVRLLGGRSVQSACNALDEAVEAAGEGADW